MTDSEVAEKLGVSRRLVSDVISNGNDSIIYHDRVIESEPDGPDEISRETIRRYCDEADVEVEVE